MNKKHHVQFLNLVITSLFSFQKLIGVYPQLTCYLSYFSKSTDQNRIDCAKIIIWTWTLQTTELSTRHSGDPKTNCVRFSNGLIIKSRILNDILQPNVLVQFLNGRPF